MVVAGPMGAAGIPRSGLQLEYPMSLGVFDKYADAQKAVDFLSDEQFPVENCMIVGTDLKQVERVTGRLTTGRVALGGALSGLWIGLFVGLIFSFFGRGNRSEEHTSELQSRRDLVCRLLLEKKKKTRE